MTAALARVDSYRAAQTVLQDATVVSTVLQQLRAPSNLRNGAKWAASEGMLQAAKLTGEFVKHAPTCNDPHAMMLSGSGD